MSVRHTPDTRTIDIDGAGPVLFVRSRRARRLGITIRTPGCVRVAVPLRVSFDQAAVLVATRATWIAGMRERLRAREETARRELAGTAPVPPAEAEKILRERTVILAQRHGFTHGRISIRDQRTRWGSCSARNAISLNRRLASLPDDLRDYVILHELVHTRIKNHGPSFWEELARYVGDVRPLRRRLRSHYPAAVPA